MKIMKYTIATTLLGIVIIALSIILVTNVKTDGTLAKDKCIQYEADKVIPTGSCYCTSKLFANWSESYDWSDSCGILRAKQ